MGLKDNSGEARRAGKIQHISEVLNEILSTKRLKKKANVH